MKRYYIVTVRLMDLAATLKEMKAVGFEQDTGYEEWGTTGGKIICGQLDETALARLQALPGVQSASLESEVDPFLRRGGGITY